MNGFRRKLNRELDRIVKNMPSEFAVKKEDVPKKKEVPFYRAAWVRCVSAVAACAVLLAVILPFAFRENSPVVKTGSVVLMEINPSVYILTDGDDRVVGVTGLNRDGDLLLADSTFTASLNGKTADDAVVLLADRAFSMGFVKEDGSNAVRLSVAGDTNAYAEDTERLLSESLVGYFCEKGLRTPVLTRTAELSEFGSGSVSETVAEIAARPTTRTEAEANGVSAEDVKENYRSAFLSFIGEITDYIEQTARGKKALLAEIAELDDAIKRHEDNPGLLISRDYWSLRDSGKKFTPTFAALMDGMEEKLALYERLYGQALSSLLFDLLSVWYESLDLTELREDLDSVERIAATLGDLFDVSLLTNLICDDDALEEEVERVVNSVKKIPSSVKEYVDSVMTMLSRSAELAREKNRAVYEAVREPITVSDYEEKMRVLEKQYGSLENFWNSFNKTTNEIV